MEIDHCGILWLGSGLVCESAPHPLNCDTEYVCYEQIYEQQLRLTVTWYVLIRDM